MNPVRSENGPKIRQNIYILQHVISFWCLLFWWNIKSEITSLHVSCPPVSTDMSPLKNISCNTLWLDVTTFLRLFYWKYPLLSSLYWTDFSPFSLVYISSCWMHWKFSTEIAMFCECLIGSKPKVGWSFIWSISSVNFYYQELFCHYLLEHLFDLCSSADILWYFA